MEFHKLVASRRSLRAFADRPVEPQKIERMLEAARWSPSCANRQPWRYVVVGKGDPSRPDVEGALDPGNAWAKRAPVLIAAGAETPAGAVVESREYALHDAGLSLMSLIYRGADQGLLVHPMAGWKEAPLRAALGLPETVRPTAVVAVGYAGKAAELDEETRRKDLKPPARKPVGEIAFRGRYGEPFRGVLPPAPAKIYETDIQLRFGDTDAMGHVNNAKVVVFFETGRVRFFAEVLGAEKVEDIRFILAEANVRYRLPIFLHDAVRLRMYVSDVSRSSFRFRCELFDPRDGRVFAEAETVQVSYDYQTGRPKPFEEAFFAKVAEYVGG